MAAQGAPQQDAFAGRQQSVRGSYLSRPGAPLAAGGSDPGLPGVSGGRTPNAVWNQFFKPTGAASPSGANAPNVALTDVATLRKGTQPQQAVADWSKPSAWTPSLAPDTTSNPAEIAAQMATISPQPMQRQASLSATTGEPPTFFNLFGQPQPKARQGTLIAPGDFGKIPALPSPESLGIVSGSPEHLDNSINEFAQVNGGYQNDYQEPIY